MTENRFHFVCSEEGKRIDVFLSENLLITRTKVKYMIDGGYVTIAGKIPKPSMKTRNLMEIDGEIPAEEPLSLTPQKIPLEILYEDEYFLAVNKPKDMVVHPSFGHQDGTLVNAVLAYLGQEGEGREQENLECRMSNLEFENQENTHQSVLGSEFHNPQPATLRPGIVHRLDKGTTGVIIVAKDSKTQEMLSALFKKRAVRKTYRAIVEGAVSKKEGAIEGNIGRHPIDRKKMAVLKEGGRDALTSFKVVEQINGFSYIEAYPKTGRTHQIRVHLSHIGHPVAGDDLYGKKAKHIADRALLHAYRIQFIHPVKGTPIVIEAPIPDDMIEFIEKYTL
ncbi:MAG: RluA family pseudouridine synthase [Proteobacteria bacterium]|nr:RluA family pseudouridine synthase [Pseudomonadota bacterium]